MITMLGRQTVAIVKPGAVAKHFAAPIFDAVDKAGFHIAALKMLWLTRKQVEAIYSEHLGKPFMPELVDFMTSGPSVAALLERPDAVAAFAALIGDPDPDAAAEGTLRKLYGENIVRNALHGSNSDAQAQFEADYLFARMERFYKHDML